MPTEWLSGDYTSPWEGHYLAAIRAQIAEFGEWVEHRPAGGTPEWVFMHFVAPQDNAHLGGAELEVAETNPLLRGIDADFATKVTKFVQYAEGHARNGTGSRMVVRGTVYQVRNPMRDSHGEIRLDIVDAQEPRDETFEARRSLFVGKGA
ncbi:hypothetical protein [Paraburkholderia sp. UCT2]|uniref:head-tail joining protein n=1 Tax=Paraburkholderia sp. UCT2 TaxID=2615208 RepID=UPI00165513AE|nr:hypothetical protein [Paraburkholderia sp. UCT2]MBC8729989.1 hypothetical protein [Paraburkholderia sp. UCT2]